MSTRRGYMSLGLRILLTIIATVQSKPVSSITEAQAYLSQYGYLPVIASRSANSSTIDDNTWIEALQEFQSFAGLNKTGKLDKETMKLMSLPRCGLQDIMGFGTADHLERYVLWGTRWSRKRLTYKILNYPSSPYISRAEVDAEFARAFAVWSEHTDLTFTRFQYGPVDIEIKFAKGEHGDGTPFLDEGGILAHAFYPEFGGDAHFSDSILWTIGTDAGTNLFQTAAHEFGHALGLSHSDVQSALMAPFYTGYIPNFTLDSDDIEAIQALYGKTSSRLTQIFDASKWSDQSS